MISKSNNNSYHDGTSAFFQRFFRKSLHLNAVEKEKKTDIDQIWQSQIKRDCSEFEASRNAIRSL